MRHILMRLHKLNAYSTKIPPDSKDFLNKVKDTLPKDEALSIGWKDKMMEQCSTSQILRTEKGLTCLKL